MPLELLLGTYCRMPLGEAAWVLPEGGQNLDAFQATIAAVQALEMIGELQILEIREENRTGRRLINAVRIRRLR